MRDLARASYYETDIVVAMALEIPTSRLRNIVVATALLFSEVLARSHLWDGSRLQVREAQTEATCLVQFSWLVNFEQQSPCLVAANLLGACAGGGASFRREFMNTNSSTAFLFADYDVPTLANATAHYDPPDTTSGTANACSWSVLLYDHDGPSLR